MPHLPRVPRAGTGSVSADQYNLLVDALGGSLVSEEFLFSETPGAGTYKVVCDLPPDSTLTGITIQTLAPWSGNKDATWNAGDEGNPKLVMDNVLAGTSQSRIARWFRPEQTAPWSGVQFAGLGLVYPDGQFITITCQSTGGTGRSLVRVFALAPRSSTAATKL